VPVRVSSGTQKGSLSALAGSKYLESIKPGKHGAAEALSQIRELPKHLQKCLCTRMPCYCYDWAIGLRVEKALETTSNFIKRVAGTF